MHAEPQVHAEHSEAPSPAPAFGTYPEAKTSGEWAIGIVFVLAAVALVAWIAWTLIGL